ncbi:MAG TPA: hypothetical protein VI754_13865 [Bacteriovoracaceae bacterium]|nr:hypothetical protein [Bacteriovoracaceae bacterium]
MENLEKFLTELESLKTDLPDHQSDEYFARYPLGIIAYEKIQKKYKDLYNTLKQQGVLKEDPNVHVTCVIIDKATLRGCI